MWAICFFAIICDQKTELISFLENYEENISDVQELLSLLLQGDLKNATFFFDSQEGFFKNLLSVLFDQKPKAQEELPYIRSQFCFDINSILYSKNKLKALEDYQRNLRKSNYLASTSKEGFKYQISIMCHSLMFSEMMVKIFENISI